MSNRLTDADKWKDVWFSNLTPYAKLLFIYLTENCNNAGVYEINKKFILFYTGLNEEQLKTSIQEITKTYIKSNDGNRIWIRNYLKYQKKLPLNVNNNNHKQIIMILQDNLNDQLRFKGCKEMESLLPLELQSVKSKKKPEKAHIIEGEKEKEETSRTPRFIKPTVQEVRDYMKEKEFRLYESEGERFVNFFESNGWKVGKNPMKSWKGAVSSWMANWYERNKIPKKGKLDNVKEAHENLDGVDWNLVYGSN